MEVLKQQQAAHHVEQPTSCADTLTLLLSQMQQTVQNSEQTTIDSNTHLQICLYRPRVDQVATLTKNYCGSFSQAEAADTPISRGTFADAPFLLCLNVLVRFLLMIALSCSTCCITAVFQTFFCQLPFSAAAGSLSMAVSGAAFTVGLSTFAAALSFWDSYLVFSYAILTWQSRCCSRGSSRTSSVNCGVGSTPPRRLCHLRKHGGAFVTTGCF